MLAIRKRRFKRKESLHERNRRRRLARRVVIAIVVMIFLFIIAGVIYAWYMGRNAKVIETAAPTTTTQKIEPYVPPADAAVAVVLQSITTPIAPGGTATVTIKTNPKAVCQITVKVGDKVFPDNALIPKTADEYGIIQWSWVVPGTSAPGKWSVEMTCANESGNSGYYKAELEVAARS